MHSDIQYHALASIAFANASIPVGLFLRTFSGERQRRLNSAHSIVAVPISLFFTHQIYPVLPSLYCEAYFHIIGLLAHISMDY